MANFVFNVAKGRTAYYASLPAANDGLVAVPLLDTGLETQATMEDYATLAAILASTNSESPVGRVALTGVTEAVDNTNDRVNMDSDNISWTAPAAGDPVGAVVICYDPDVSAGTDADLIPLTHHDVVWTPDGNDFTLTVNDFARATS